MPGPSESPGHRLSSTRESATTDTPKAHDDRTIGSPRLHIIPVDAQRLFAHWYVPASVLTHASEQLTSSPETSQLTLRVLDVTPGKGRRRRTEMREDFPATSGWHEGFVSLESPGGSVAASLGIKERDGTFHPLLTSLAVTLPKPPPPPAIKPPVPRNGTARSHPPPRPRPTPAPIHAATPAPPAAAPAARRAAPEPRRWLDEKAIVQAALGPADLLPELRRVPEDVAAKEIPQERAGDLEHTNAPSVPKTPTLDERSTIAAILTATTTPVEARFEPSPLGPESVPVSAVGEPAAGGASERLASHFDPATGHAPIELKATLVITGRVQPGHRLRIGNQSIEVRPGGTFHYRQPLTTFSMAWDFLRHVVSSTSEADLPSLELLAHMPDDSSPLTLHATVDIEGQLRDASYVAHLPAGVSVDEAGRFRIVRRLPAGAWFLPQLALFAQTNTGN